MRNHLETYVADDPETLVFTGPTVPVRSSAIEAETFTVSQLGPKLDRRSAANLP
jgi:hypothetical protein